MSCACFYAQKAADIAGYPSHSPSSGDSPEKIYATPSDDDDDREWYSESPPRKSMSPASKKAFEEELDALSSHSSNPEGRIRVPKIPGIQTVKVSKKLGHGAHNTSTSNRWRGPSANARELNVYI